MNATVTAAPLPTNFVGTPQQFIDAFLDRLEVVVEETAFVVSDVQPTGNQGPWLKNGTQWWVWDDSTSTYVPLDISASIPAQIYVGDVSQGPPNPAQYKIWLQLNGSVFNGFYYYAGSVAGWVTEPTVLTAGCITSSPVNMLSAGCILTAAIGNAQVTPAKLAPNLPLTIIGPGNPYQIVQTNQLGNLPQWSTLMSVSPNFNLYQSGLFSNLRPVAWAHGLPKTPSLVRVVLVCVLPNEPNGYSLGDEVWLIGNCGQPTGSAPGVASGVTVYANATTVKIMNLNPLVLNQTGSTNVYLDVFALLPLTFDGPLQATPYWEVKIYAGCA